MPQLRRVEVECVGVVLVVGDGLGRDERSAITLSRNETATYPWHPH